MQLYFIRHAQSKNNALYEQTGSSSGRSEDPELSDTGIAQAAMLSEFLHQRIVMKGGMESGKEFVFSHIYTSLMVRAVATGSQIARAFHLPLIGWLDLHECGGIYLDDPSTGEAVGLSGKSSSYFANHYPLLSLPEEVSETGWWNRPEEPREERLPRAKRVVQLLLQRHAGTDDQVAIISHGGFFRYFLDAFLEMQGNQNIWFTLNNASVSRFDCSDEHIDVMYLNRFDYLPPEMVT